MALQNIPEIINFDKAVALNSSYEGVICHENLPRLAEACTSITGDAEASFRFYKDLQGLRMIEGKVSCEVEVICQRCGEPFKLKLAASYKCSCDYEKAESLKIADRMEFVEPDENSDLNMFSFLEECLLLELPYAPTHEEGSPDCKRSGSEWSYGELAKEAEESPFAALSGLKEAFAKQGKKDR